VSLSPLLLASYRPRRQNTQTGRLAEGLLFPVFLRARAMIEEPLR
jgi:hypothetical protein